MAKIARTVILKTRVTPKENALIQKEARRAQASVSDVLRVAAKIFCEEQAR